MLLLNITSISFLKKSYFYSFSIVYQIGEKCGDTECEFGGECCMMCGRNGELVPSGECSNPMQGGPPCPLVHCEVPITLPPVIIDDQGENMIVAFSL